MFLTPPSPILPPEPKVVTRQAVNYIGIESLETMRSLGTLFPREMPRLGEYLARKRLHPAGAPFIQYVRVAMPGQLQVILGEPVKERVRDDQGVVGRVLPAGRYAELTYYGPNTGLERANSQLQAWCAKRRLGFKMKSTPEGVAFVARFESSETDPRKEPDPARWRTDIYYLLDR